MARGEWPETVTQYKVEEGVIIPVRVPHRLLNANDPDVRFAYINSSSCGPDADLVTERGIAKAQFEATTETLDLLKYNYLRDVVKALLAVKRPRAKIWIQAQAGWDGRLLARALSILGTGELHEDGWTAEFSAITVDREVQLLGTVRLARTECAVQQEQVPVATVRRGRPGLVWWARKAAERVRKGAALVRQLDRLKVDFRGSDDDY